MKQFFHKIASISLALIVVFSSFSFTVNTHFCGGEVANTAFFVSADNCGMDMKICKSETSKQQASLDKEPCCNDISEFIQGTDTNQQAQGFQLELSQMQFITAFVYSYITQFQEDASIASCNMYEPPSVYKNIQAFFQVFRI